MLIADILKAIHIKYEFNVEYFDETSEDCQVRLALVNDKINMWENEDGILWRELFVTVNDTLDSNGEFDLTDFILPANDLVIGDERYEYISPELLQANQYNEAGNVFTITGGDGEKKLSVYPNPGFANFSLRYYKKARTYTSTTDLNHVEMADPYFIVNAVVSELFLDDGDTEKAGVAIQIATQKLDAMKTKNATVPVFVDTKQADYNFNGFGN